MRGKTKKTDCLLVVAHPDDETIFFSSVMLKFSHRLKVICVTDGNADGLGEKRKLQFLRACKSFKVAEAVMWDFPDTFEKRLPVRVIAEAIKKELYDTNRFSKVFTHGILGEYGHPHHQDVSFATHEAFEKNSSAKIYSTAYNIFPDLVFKLSKSQFEKKTRILWNVYGSEIRRLLNFLPARETDTFAKVKFEEIQELYRFLILHEKSSLKASKFFKASKSFKAPKSHTLDPKKLKKYLWLKSYLESGDNRLLKRPF